MASTISKMRGDIESDLEDQVARLSKELEYAEEGGIEARCQCLPGHA